MANDLASKLREWQAKGWSATKTSGNHIKLQHPEASNAVIVASTPSDVRAIPNTEAKMRRAMPNRQIEIIPDKPKENNLPALRKEANIESNPLPVSDKKEFIFAWALAYCHLRLNGCSMISIKTAKQRYRTEQTFREKLLNGYRTASPYDMAIVRLTLRKNGAPKIPNFMRGMSIPVPLEQSATQLHSQSSFSVAKQQIFEEKLSEQQKLLSAQSKTIASLQENIKELLADISLYSEEIDHLKDDISRLTSENARLVRNTKILEGDKLALQKSPPSSSGIDVELIASLRKAILGTFDDVVEDFKDAQEEAIVPVKKAAPKKVSMFVKPPVDRFANKDTTPGEFLSQGERIRACRKKEGMTIAQFAKKMKVHPSAVCHWEADRHPPSPENLDRIAKMFSTTTKYLMSGK